MDLKREIARKGLFRILPSNTGNVLDDRVLLYRAIIDRFLLDCFHIDEEIREECRKWFSMENKLFFEVCDYADLEQDFVVQYVKKAFVMIKEQEIEKGLYEK